MTYESYPYGTSQTKEAVKYPRSRCIGERPEHGVLELEVFAKEDPKTGDISYGMKAHGSNMGINTAIDDVIVRLCYCHRAEVSMHMHGRIGW